MKKLYLSFILLLITAISAFGEDIITDDKLTEANIVGHVIEKKTGDHIPGVAIIVEGTSLGTVTDATGHYRFTHMPLGKWTLKVRVLGYMEHPVPETEFSELPHRIRWWLPIS